MGNIEDAIVLYVDDEKANRIVFEQSFKERFRIKSVGSGAEALDVLANHTVAILVTDQRMPEMSGNELLERAKVLYPTVVRVVITAYGDLDPILRAVNDGLVARYIVKPWSRAELEQILAWGIEAFTLGQHNSALQLRLMQTERLVTLGSIGAAVMHDLNQPLAYMLSNTERLRQLSSSMPALAKLVETSGNVLAPADRDKLQELSQELGAIVEDMVAGGKVMHELTASIRRLVRPAPDPVDNAVEPVPVVRYALSVCQEIALRSRGSLHYDGPSHVVKVRVGSTELTQILINFIANAAQALLRRDKPGGRVTVFIADKDEQVRFTIKDNGPGMSPEVLAKIGTPFFSTRPEGTGLGIAQCRRLVEQAGGKVDISSKEGAGTIVTFMLPKA